MMSYYKPNTDIGTPSSTSDRGGGGNGMSLLFSYFTIFINFLFETFLQSTYSSK